MPAAFAQRIAALDRAPIVLAGSRKRAVFLFAACAAFIALGLFAVLRGEEDVLAVAAPTALLFGLGMALACAQIARPSVMTIAADGVEVRALFRTSRIAWDEVDAFFVHRIRAAGPAAQMPDVAAFKWREGAVQAGGRSGLFRVKGCDGTFGAGWPLSAPALTGLLNAARERCLARDRV